MGKGNRPGRLGRSRLAGRSLGELLARHPGLLKVLDRHGVTFCPGCFLTLHSPLDKAAAYHAVRDLRLFLKDVERALRG